MMPSLGFAAPASVPAARPAARVVVVFATSGADERGPTARRVRAELVAAGFDVHSAQPPPGGDVADAWAGDLLQDEAILAVAHLRVLEDDTAEVLWWQRDADRDGAPSLTRRSVRSAAESGVSDGAELLAVRAAELAAAASDSDGNRERIAPKPAPSTDVQPLPPSPTPPPRWRARLTIGPAWSPGGLGLMLQPTLGGSFALGRARRFGVGADVSVTAVRGRVALDGARRDVGIAMLGTHAVWWPRPGRKISPSLALGGGLALAWVSPTPYTNTAVGMISAAPAIAFEVLPHVALALGLRAALLVPRLEVASGQTRLAGAGQPLLDGWVGIEFRG